jgi:hypothetical protein
MAPKPVQVGAALYDYFPIEGAQETVRRARQIYALFGAEDKVGIAYSPRRHGFSQELRQAVVNWMRRHLKGEPGDFVTGQPATLPEAELNCTGSGQVLAAFPATKTVFDVNSERLHRVGRPVPPADPTSLRRTVTRVLGIDSEDYAYPINPRIIAEEVVEGYFAQHVWFFSQPDVCVTGIMLHPRGGAHAVQTDLVLLPRGTNSIPRERLRVESLLSQGHRLFVFDPRGLGAVETRPLNSRDRWADEGTEFKLACDAMMLGGSTLGLRVFDALRGLAFLRQYEAGGATMGSTPGSVCAASAPIGIYGLGFGALVGYLAAALDGRVASVTVEDMLVSYWILAHTRYYSADLYRNWAVAWGTLAHFDLPDLLRCIAPAACRIINPRDAKGNIVDAATFRREFLDVAAQGQCLPRDWQPSVVLPCLMPAT